MNLVTASASHALVDRIVFAVDRQQRLALFAGLNGNQVAGGNHAFLIRQADSLSGFYRFVGSFQASHALPLDGLVGQATWSALLRYSPIRVRWVHRGRRIVALSRGATQTLPVPQSARLHAKRNEIPGSGGAGWPQR